MFRLPFLLLLFSSFVGTGCKGNRGQSEAPAVAVKIAKVEHAVLDDATEYIARIKSRRSVVIHPRVEGQVRSLLVKSGDTVKEGDSLIQLDPIKQQAVVEGSRAAHEWAQAEEERIRALLTSMQAQRSSKLAKYKLAQQRYDRTVSLHASQIVSQEELDSQRTNLEAAKADLDAIEAEIEAQRSRIAGSHKTVMQNEASAHEQEELLRYYRIVAPFDGVVGDIPVKIGERVTQSTRLTTLDQTGELEAYVYLPAERATDLHLGTRVVLVGVDGKALEESSVSFISPQVDPDTQSLLIKTSFDNDQKLLRAGQSVRARVVWKTHEGATIPRISVFSLNGQDFVFVVQGEVVPMKVEQRPIAVGPIQDNRYPVLKGLAVGDRIVVAGIQKLTDGSLVSPISE